MHFGCTKQWAKGKKGRTHTSEEKTKEKQNSVTIMISADRKGTAFSSEVEIRRRIVWIKILKKRISKKDQMNLSETNHKINMISENFVSSNKLFKPSECLEF